MFVSLTRATSRRTRVGGVAQLHEHFAEHLHRPDRPREPEPLRLIGHDRPPAIRQLDQLGRHQEQEAVAGGR